MEHLSGVITPKPQLKVSAKVKTFVLDTNVLLHDPQSLFSFEENNLVIPVEVLEELDAIKGEQSTERGRNARRVHRHLQELLPDSRTMLEGVKLTCTPPVTVKVKFCFDEPAELLAVKLMLNVPLFVGVPLRVPVPLPLSWKPTLPGNPPDSVKLGVGYPAVVTVNEPSTPSWKVVLLALVITGVCSTVKVNVCIAEPAVLLAVKLML